MSDIWTEQIVQVFQVFRNIQTYTQTTTTTESKEIMSLRDGKVGGSWNGLEGGNETMKYDVITISKLKLL